MKITKIAFTVYAVTDLKRARNFYETVLGLTATKVYGDDAKGMVEYDLGPDTLSIGCGATQFTPSAGGGCVALEAEDFEEAIKHLRDGKVKFVTEPVETPVCHIAIFSDPDGNTLMLHRRKA